MVKAPLPPRYFRSISAALTPQRKAQREAQRREEQRKDEKLYQGLMEQSRKYRENKKREEEKQTQGRMKEVVPSHSEPKCKQKGSEMVRPKFIRHPSSSQVDEEEFPAKKKANSTIWSASSSRTDKTKGKADASLIDRRLQTGTPPPSSSPRPSHTEVRMWQSDDTGAVDDSNADT